MAVWWKPEKSGILNLSDDVLECGHDMCSETSLAESLATYFMIVFQFLVIFVIILGISYIGAHVPMSPRARTSVPDDWLVTKASESDRDRW